MPDSAADIQNQLKTKIANMHDDRLGQYAVLLGRNVMKTMAEKIGDDNALAYITALDQFGRALDKNTAIDIFEIMPVHQITAFSNFNQYQMLLKRLLQQLRVRKDESLKGLIKLLETVIEIGDKTAPAPETSEATAASKEKPQFYSDMFTGKSLPQVPLSMIDRDNLPKSYPDFNAVCEIVVSRFNKSEFRPKLYSLLNACVRKSLKAVALHRKYTESKETDPRDYLAEAQQYLMDYNWIGYGRDHQRLAVASERLDRANVPSFVDYTDNILVVAGERTEAYAFLGVNLEQILRKFVFELANDVKANFTIDGKQAALAVVVAACSSVVQEAALVWLEHIQDAFNDVAEKRA